MRVLAALLLLLAFPRPGAAAIELNKPPSHQPGSGAAASTSTGEVRAAAAAAADGPVRWQWYESLFPTAALLPTVTSVRGHEVVYQIPDSPRATLFVAPGCSHAAHDWWPPSDACPDCLGLPEEVGQTQQALARGYAVLAMTASANSTDQCMDWGNNHRDAVEVIKAFLKEHKLRDLPLYALGVSVGGGFVMKLPQYLKMDGVLSEVLGPKPAGFNPWTYEHRMPPSVFVSMDQDPQMAARISQDAATLRALGVPTATVRVPPRQVYPAFFSDRSPRIDAPTSARVVAALHQIGMLDDQGMVTQDPRHTRKPWVRELVELLPDLQSGMTEDHSHVWEEMNLAYSSHEIIADFATAAFLWFESGGKADFADLVRQYAPAGCGVVGDAADVLRPLPLASTTEAAAGAAAAQPVQLQQHQKQEKEEEEQQADLVQQEQQDPEQQQQQEGIQLEGIQLEGHRQAEQASSVRDLGAGRLHAAEEEEEGQEGRVGVQVQVQQPMQQEAQQAQQQAAQQAQQQQAQTAEQQAVQQARSADGTPSVSVKSAHAEAPEAIATGDIFETTAAAHTDGAHSAASIVGGVAGTLTGAAVLLVLYRLSERRRAGFAALPTHGTEPWQRGPGHAPKLLPIIVEEGPGEADP